MLLKSSHPHWHVVYTLPRSEKKVASYIIEMGFEAYVPLKKEVRQWSDRKIKIEVPLFPNYVFVKVDEAFRSSLYLIKGLIKFVSIDRKPVIIKDDVIEQINKVLNGDHIVRCEDYFHKGVHVKIQHGKLAGIEGVILQRRGTSRLLVRIEGIMKAFSFNISTQDVALLLKQEITRNEPTFTR